MAIKYDQIMLDTETLATSSNAVILSIGAVKFKLDGSISDQAFYASISVDSQKTRHIAESTLLWWMKQSPEARAVFHEPKDTLDTALRAFALWIDHEDYCVWSNGADFDIPLVGHAFDSYQLERPWKFWNQRCFRTMKSTPPGMYVTPPVGGVAHNAVDDALNQTKHLIEIFKSLRNIPAPENYSAKKRTA